MDAVRVFCACGHSEAWHTGPAPLVDPVIAAQLAMNFYPVPGNTCDRCDCSGFIGPVRNHVERVWTP